MKAGAELGLFSQKRKLWGHLTASKSAFQYLNLELETDFSRGYVEIGRMA